MTYAEGDCPCPGGQSDSARRDQQSPVRFSLNRESRGKVNESLSLKLQKTKWQVMSVPSSRPVAPVEYSFYPNWSIGSLIGCFLFGRFPWRGSNQNWQYLHASGLSRGVANARIRIRSQLNRIGKISTYVIISWNFSGILVKVGGPVSENSNLAMTSGE